MINLLKRLVSAARGGDTGKTWVPPGHFYSPIPNLDEVKRLEGRLWAEAPREVKGVDLNVKEQLKVLGELAKHYGELPFRDEKQPGTRYHYDNGLYSYCDAIFLYSMIRRLEPKRIVEVGSGYSSAVTLDVNELFFDGSISCTFIEPFPKVLNSLLKEEDRESATLIERNLQDVDVEVFGRLKKGDILFIDSTHVAKTGSDVNYIFSEILPRLNSGVYIHFHDIFYPFEYPREWVYEGRAWNELYMLRAFLQYNRSFRMVLFSTYLARFHRDVLERDMPLCLKNPGGNIWLRKC